MTAAATAAPSLLAMTSPSSRPRPEHPSTLTRPNESAASLAAAHSLGYTIDESWLTLEPPA